MNDPVDIDVETVRSEALRKLGRNIVNFSKIEAALKYLLSVSQLEGTKATISEQLHENESKHCKETLGKLVRKFHENVLVDASQFEATITSSDSEFFSSLNITCDDQDFLKSQKRSLSNIVAERNKLIHQDLALLDTSCIEEYRKLIVFLDEQNPRLLAHLEELRWIIESDSYHFKILEELLKSPEFIKWVKSHQSDV